MSRAPDEENLEMLKEAFACVAKYYRTAMARLENRRAEVVWYLDYRLYLAIFLPIAFISYHLPADIFITNSRQLYIDLSNILKSGLLISLVSALLIFAPLSYFTHKRYQNVSVAPIFFLVLFFVNGLFPVTSDGGLLMGKMLEFEFATKTYVYSLLSIVVLLFVLTRFKRRVRRMIESGVTVAAALILLYPLITDSIYPKIDESEKPRRLTINEKKELVSFSKNRNIIFVLFDSVSDDMAAEVLGTPHNRKTFKDFTYYEDTVGASPQTEWSMLQIFSGRFFRENYALTFRKDFNASYRDSSFINDLGQNGWHTAAIGWLKHRCAKLGTLCAAETLENLSFKDYERFLPSEYIRLLNVSFLKAAPVFLKESVYNEGDWLIRQIDFDKPADERSTLDIRMERHQKYLEFIASLESHLQATYEQPAFKYWHFQVTHPFFHIGEDCLPSRKRTNVSVATDCAFKGLGTFFELLKREGVYDRSAIIIASDHGLPRPNKKVSRNAGKFRPVYPAEKSQKEFEASVSLANPMLLFKNFNSTGSEPRRNSDPVHSIDIAKTVCDLAELPCPRLLDSVSLTDPERAQKYAHRKRLYVDHKYGPTLADIQAYTLMEIASPVWNPESWKIFREAPPRP